MKLSAKLNWILLPIMVVIFSMAGVVAYHSQKAQLRTSVIDQLIYESQYIIDDLQKSMAELDLIQEMFLGSMEITQYLLKQDQNYRTLAIEPQILKHVNDIKLSQGTISSFGLVDAAGEELLYFNAKDPFASFEQSSVLNQHIVRIESLIKPEGISKIKSTSYEFKVGEQGILHLIVYKTFSPYHPISEGSFSKSFERYTAVVTVDIDIEQHYFIPLRAKLSPDINIALNPRYPGVVLSYQFQVRDSFSPDQGLGTLVETNNLAVALDVPMNYLHQLYQPYRNAIISLVINVTLITFLFLKWLIHRQVINPVMRLSTLVEKAKSGDISGLSRAPQTDEVASLNNNYFELFQTLNQMARFDSLTGLANRSLFNSAITRVIKQAKHTKTKCALLYLDLDNFKNVNDNYGHHVGDLLLQTFAVRLKQSFRASDLLMLANEKDSFARLAGDEFALLLPDMPSVEVVAQMATRITKLCRNGFELEGATYDIRVSIGIAICPDDAVTAEQLLQRADAAMYQVKRAGKNGFQFYSHTMEKEHQQHLLIEAELKTALAEDGFYLLFMPIFNCHTGKVVGAEALLRSNAKTLQEMGPAAFIPVAEQTGLIKDIDYWVLDHALSKLRTLIQEYDFNGKMAVNFSAQQLKNLNFVDDIKGMLEQYQVPPQQLELEITETCFVPGETEHISLFQQLRALGVGLSLDDFGTGYTAFNQLRDFPVDQLKVDRAFIWDIDSEAQQGKLLVDVIVELGELYDLEVVAEGVETPAQLEHIRQLGCDQAQGFLLSKPIDWEALITLWQDNQPSQFFTKGVQKLELSLKSSSGSVKIQVVDTLITYHYRGVITAKLLDDAINLMPQCLERLTSPWWGVIVITERHAELTSKFRHKMADFIQQYQPRGCVEGVYVVEELQAVGNQEALEASSQLLAELQGKLFGSQQQAETYLKEQIELKQDSAPKAS